MILALGVGSLSLAGSAGEAGAKPFHVLYSFGGGSDGGNPEGSLLLSRKDALIGTSSVGGVAGCGNSGLGCGTVFEFKKHSEKTLYSFRGGSDGDAPIGDVIEDNSGNLIGTTAGGGSYGAGTVFKLTPDGTETLVYTFQDRTDGAAPYGGIIEDTHGNFFGTASQGGAGDWGTVFEISASGTFSVLHSFSFTDGGDPLGNLLLDKSGNLYGTTYVGGAASVGAIYKVASNGTQTVLHSFGGTDGSHPTGTLISDSAGNLYGTTGTGGSKNLGTVFEQSTNGTETVLHSFQGSHKDGSYPAPMLILDTSGNLYGTADEGGKHNGGIIFKLAPDGAETVLYNFTGGKDGSYPYGGIVADSKGHLYGSAEAGSGSGCSAGGGCGTLFETKE